MAKKILLSGIKPTGRPHLGNYLGAMRQFVELQDEYKSYIFIADYHALTTLYNPKELAQNTIDVALDYLAIGLDPHKVTIFKQSDMHEHTELAWIFNCITTMPYLMRAHAFKDAQAKNKDISVGSFDYPMLMAADILMYDPDVVPVGQDQKQHIEFARDTAEKFNHTFDAEIFKLPKQLIPENVATVPGIDGQKMSKSYNNTIPLFATDEELKKAVMSIVTDSKDVSDKKDPESCNVFALHKHFSASQLAELKERYESGDIGYKESKEVLLKNIIDFTAPLKGKREALAKDIGYVNKILEDGARDARKVASEKIKKVKTAIGVNP